MAASAECCAHCGKQGAGFKRCSVCKQACYCGVACQNANWKRHKKTCTPPVPLQDVAAKINAAHAAEDWRGVLKWEGRMEEMMAHQSDVDCLGTLKVFAKARQTGFNATGSKDHTRACIALEERRIPLLGKLQRFRDQGEAMCSLSNILHFLCRKSEAATWFQRARDVGAAHGFFSLESVACKGIGEAEMRGAPRRGGGAAAKRAGGGRAERVG